MTGEDVAARVHAYAWTDRKPGLERTRTLLAALGNPEKALKFVHITGSNGKGSTAAMLASVLAAAGYRTGLFTSPHLYRFNERFQVNGAPIPDAALDRLAERVLAAADTLPEHPTEFELMTAIGFLWFAEAGCDLVVVEVGLGGRLDSTNVIPRPRRRSSPTSGWSTPPSSAAPSPPLPRRNPASSSPAAAPCSTVRAAR
ncbi:MAG: hypothetical protein UCQ96_05975 [Oscillospiraceae bacterium]|nr:hypothetical protein [Oscillospiraceae bacterium]